MSSASDAPNFDVASDVSVDVADYVAGYVTGQVTEGGGGIRILAATTDAAVLSTIERTCSSEKHHFLFVTDVAEAIATGTREQPDLAFVDVTLEGGAGLALVHHLPAVCSHTLVYAIVPSSHLEFGSQAMALGAAGILLAPPSGDGLLLAMGEVRQRRAAGEERARLQSELATWKRRTELVERVARLADEGDRTKAALAIAEALAEASRASGVAIYSVDGDSPKNRTRLAAVGSAALLDDDRMGESLEGVRLLTLTLGGRTVGYALLDNASGLEGDAMRPLLEMASAVLAAGQPRPSASDALHDARGAAAWSRIYAHDQFKDTASREIDRARRHGRRLVIGVILAPSVRESFLEPILLDAIRESDVLAKGAPGEYWLLLPETGAVGAHACTRRVMRHASPVEGRIDSAKPSIGIAAYPHDGQTFDSLAAKARARALEATNSIVHAHPFAAKPLAHVIDTLLAAPMPASGEWSPRLARVDLPPGAVLPSLAAAACGEALRGGNATILMAFREESRTLQAVRAIVDGKDATLHVVESRRFDDCDNAEALVVVAEHGTWTLCARLEGTRTRLVHSADPLLADVVAQKLAKAGGVRLG
jgi:ActR/RegA family two-component response regulator